MKTGEELICFLEKSFPQLSVREVGEARNCWRLVQMIQLQMIPRLSPCDER